MEQLKTTHIIVVVTLALLTSFGQYSVLAGDSQPYDKVHAFYYPWYGNLQTDKFHYHWNHQQFVKEGEAKNYPGGDDVAANFYPKLGCYSSNSDQDLDAHMLMLRRAKAGVISTSWWGKDSYTDKAVPRLLDAAAKHNIKVCFHIEPFPGRNAQSTRDAIVYIIDRYGSHSAFYRYGKDKPHPMFYRHRPVGQRKRTSLYDGRSLRRLLYLFRNRRLHVRLGNQQLARARRMGTAKQQAVHSLRRTGIPRSAYSAVERCQYAGPSERRLLRPGIRRRNRRPPAHYQHHKLQRMARRHTNRTGRTQTYPGIQIPRLHAW